MFLESGAPLSNYTKVFKKGRPFDLCLSLDSCPLPFILRCDPKDPEGETRKSTRGKKESLAIKLLTTVSNGGLISLGPSKRIIKAAFQNCSSKR